jgi:hypothetical protein
MSSLGRGARGAGPPTYAERRRIRIVVTESGHERVVTAMATVRAWWRSRLARLAPAELNRLIAAMQTLETLLAPAQPLEAARPVQSRDRP